MPRDLRSSLFVTGFSQNIISSELEEVFLRWGPIKDVYIPVDFYTKKPKRYAYIEYHHPENCETAFQETMNGVKFHDMSLSVQYAHGQRKCKFIYLCWIRHSLFLLV
ncbi:hypothetical protein GQ42DRAFT_150001 [Ramicandelaber brevisporus]|nr:hypothetical protein GQ42DRAFT_150001 [Ramicandelaber brevisporus]